MNMEENSELPASKDDSFPESVFIVDDEELLGETLRMVLMTRSQNVKVFKKALNAVEELIRIRDSKEGLPELVVSDLMMPEMNGDEFIHTLFDIFEARESALPFQTLIITGYNDEAATMELLQRKGVHLLTKPFTGVEFLDKVEEISCKDS